MKASIEQFDGVRFARLPIVNFTATMRKASWQAKSADYPAFGTVGYSISADTAEHIRDSFGLDADVRVGVATRADFDLVETINAKLAMSEHAGKAFVVNGNASLTVGISADDVVRTSIDKDGNTWVNLTLVMTDETAGWQDRPSSLGTTARLASAM